MPGRHPIGPSSTRVFAGFKAANLDRDEFYRELGHTFMPGTPYMQAPMGLNAYLPAVLDPAGMPIGAAEAGILPDEVALIVYSSLDDYEKARKHSLRRRMYTHSHLAVFDMDKPGGGGQFPGPISDPHVKGDRLCWYVFDNEVDWQWGETQLLFAIPDFDLAGRPSSQVEETEHARDRLAAAGVDQLLGLATTNYVALWVHSEEPVDSTQLGLVHDSYMFVTRHLVADPFEMPVLEEDMTTDTFLGGPTISEPSMMTFRFQRDDRFLS